MSFRRIIKGSLISLAVLGMVGGSLNNNVANAKHRRYHYRLHRKTRRKVNRYGYWKKYRHHGRTHYTWHRYKSGYFHNGKWIKYRNHRAYRYKLSKRAHKLYNKVHISNHSKNTHDPYDHNVSQNLHEMKSQTLTDINNDRKEYGLTPMMEDPKLDKLASIRAQQMITDGVNHYDANGEFYGTKDAPLVDLPSNFDCSENIADAFLGTSTQASGHGDNHTSTNYNGYDMANTKNDNMMNHDEPNWGHRHNILKSDHLYVGIGTSYNHGRYNLAEDFYDEPLNNNNDESDNDDNESQSQSSYNYNSNNNNNGSSSSISESSDDGSNNININNNNNNTTSSNSDNDSYVNPLAGKTIHKNGVTVTYTKDGMIARDNNGDTSSASGPNSTINIDGQTFTD